MKKHEIKLRVRRIDNGYIVTGCVENRVGSKRFPESFVPSLQALDMAISERLSGAEKMADEIKAPAHDGTAYTSILRLWGGNEESDDDGDDW